MKLNKLFLAFHFIAAAVMFSSCEDTIDYRAHVAGDGEANVEAIIEFNTESAYLGGPSRTSGTAIGQINNLHIFVYKQDGTFYTDEYIAQPSTSTQFPDQLPTDYPKDEDGKPTNTETGTTRVTGINLNLPYGRYYIYAAANIGVLDEEQQEKVKTIEGLKGLTFEWDFQNISANAQMFGYFQNGTNSSTTAFLKEDPTVLINENSPQIHCWLKRLASKVTIAYDGEGLNPGVNIYIHNVSIRQIPKYCTLGFPNSPHSPDSIDTYMKSMSGNIGTYKEQILFYNNEGVADDVPENPGFETSTQDYLKWLHITKGIGTVGSDQSNSAQALFFYENMQGDYRDNPNKKWYDKRMDPDSVGTNITEGMDDYKDNVPFGTYIEVEAYYLRTAAPVSYGPIRYRFMLGQDCEYNYDAIRNHHYKLTLGFKGEANQPDWHIEYKEEDHEIYATDVYVPYSYNTYVDYPVTIVGDVTSLTAEIIENNWAPYQEGAEYDVAPLSKYGSTDFATRTLEFNWWRDVFVNNGGYDNEVNINTVTLSGTNPNFTNSTSNYLYGRHRAYNKAGAPLYHLNDDGSDDTSNPYYVSPIWAGFLRLQQPVEYENMENKIPAYLLRYLSMAGYSSQYGAVDGTRDGRPVLTAFRDYYFGNLSGSGFDGETNTTDLRYRVFTDMTPGWHHDDNNGSTIADPSICRNAYHVEKEYRDGKIYTTITLRLWTQPKSMCGISAFTGNNPYEEFNRKAVVRFTANFAKDSEGHEVGQARKDINVLQARRLVNPKAVWRAHRKPGVTATADGTPDPFNVTIYERTGTASSTFTPLESQGAWTATIDQGNEDGFISLVAQGGASGGGNQVNGGTGPIKFQIKFAREIASNESKCAIIKLTYHGNSAVHQIYVRQGYNEPLQLDAGGPYWSSFNVLRCENNTTLNTQYPNSVNAYLTSNPLSFGAMFKRGAYNGSISTSNISDNVAAFGPLAAPGNSLFTFNSSTRAMAWSTISGNTDRDWEFAKFKVNGRTYRVPTLAEYQTLIDGDFGIGVLYGDGATQPGTSTLQAFGYLDDGNSTSSTYGMRGFICYDPNPDEANHVFFPVGTSGMGRRTIQLVNSSNERGTLRYGATPFNLNSRAVEANSLRPIAVNMMNVPGAIYWINKATQDASDGNTWYTGWDMNYFDLNFNGAPINVVSRNNENDKEGPGGDALPIRLVYDPSLN